MKTIAEKTQEIKSYIKSLHEDFKSGIEITDKQIIKLSNMLYERDRSGPLDGEMLNISHGVTWGMQIFRQIVQGNDL